MSSSSAPFNAAVTSAPSSSTIQIHSTNDDEEEEEIKSSTEDTHPYLEVHPLPSSPPSSSSSSSFPSKAMRRLKRTAVAAANLVFASRIRPEIFESDGDDLDDESSSRRKLDKSVSKFVKKLAPGLFWGEAARAPSALAHVYVGLFLVIVPPYLIAEAIANVATWWTVFVIFLLLVARLIVAGSRALVYPGSLSWIKRSQEELVATEMKHRTIQASSQLKKLANAPVHVRDRAAHAMIELKRDFFAIVSDSVKQHVSTHPELNEGPCAEQIEGLSDALFALNAELDLDKLVPANRASVNDDNTSDRLRVIIGLCDQIISHSESAWAGKPSTSSQEAEDEEEEGNENRYVRYRDAIVERIKEYLRIRSKFAGIASLEWMQSHLSSKYPRAIHEMVTSFDKLRVDVFFIPGINSVETVSTTTILWCQPNAGLYELNAIYPFWLDYFHKKNVNVIVWNYRGYGNSQGRCTPHRLIMDGEAVLKRGKEVFPATTSFCVHGESMGGLVACHLANKFPGWVSALVCDRTFASLEKVVEAHVGNALKRFLVRLTSWGSGDNVENFVAASTPNKLILQDVQDHIVPFWASLKVGVAHASLVHSSTATRYQAMNDVELGSSSTASSALARFLNDYDEFEGFIHALFVLQGMAFLPNETNLRCAVRSNNKKKHVRYEYKSLPNLTTEERALISISEVQIFVRLVLCLKSPERLLGKALEEDLLSRTLSAEMTSQLESKFKPMRFATKARVFCGEISRQADPTIGIRATRDWFATSACFDPPDETNAERFVLAGVQGRLGDLESCDRALAAFMEVKKSSLENLPKIKVHLDRVAAGVHFLRSSAGKPPCKSVVLACGHNGFPSADSIRQVEEFYRAAGFYP